MEEEDIENFLNRLYARLPFFFGYYYRRSFKTTSMFDKPCTFFGTIIVDISRYCYTFSLPRLVRESCRRVWMATIQRAPPESNAALL